MVVDEESLNRLLDAKHSLINEIERLSSILTVDAKIVKERMAVLDTVTQEIKSLHCPTDSRDRYIKLNIGGHKVDIQREVLALGPWNLLSRALSPDWSGYLLQDNDGRIFFDFDIEWVDPILSYFRALRFFDEQTRTAKPRLSRPSNATSQQALGFACVLDYFDLSHLVDFPKHAQLSAHAASSQSSVDDELLASLASQLAMFRMEVDRLRNENHESQQYEDRITKETVFIADLIKQWMVQAHGEAALAHFQDTLRAEAPPLARLVLPDPQAPPPSLEDGGKEGAVVFLNAQAEEKFDEDKRTESPFSQAESEDVGTETSKHANSLHTAMRRLSAVVRARESILRDKVEDPIVRFNVGGQKVCILRNTLLQAFPGSRFASILSGNHFDPTLPCEKDANGCIFLDVPKEAFLALISYARLLSLRGEDSAIKVETEASTSECKLTTVAVFIPAEHLDVFFTLQDLLQISDDFPLESA